MEDQYQVLGLEQGARQEEVQAAFDELLAARKARRGKTSDLHVACAVLSDPVLRRAHDLARMGISAGGKLSKTKDAALGFAADAIPDIDVAEVVAQIRELGLKLTVVGCGALAKGADVTARASRAVQSAARRRLLREE